MRGQPRFVVQPFGDDDVGQSQSQCAIGGRFGGDMPVGAFGGARTARINHHQLRAGALGVFQVGHKMGRGADRIVPPHNDQFAVGNVFVARGAARAKRGFDGKFGRRATNRALQLARAQTIPETAVTHRHLHQSQRAAVAVRQNSRRPMLGDDGPPACPNFAQGFAPGDGLPFAAAFGANAAQRRLQPVGMVNVVEIRPYLGAQPALGDGMIGVGVKINGTAVFHLGNQAAGIGTIVGASAANFYHG